MKLLTVATAVFCMLYIIMLLQHGGIFQEDYYGFMRLGATVTSLPTCLMLTCAGHTRYRPFERVHRNPRTELDYNLRWLVISGVGCGLACALLFTIVEIAIGNEVFSPEAPSLLALLTSQLIMMNIAIALLQLLATNCGVPWGFVTPLFIAFYAVAPWMLGTVSDQALYVIMPFWYPISHHWDIALVRQVMPFVGLCVLATLLNVAAFEHWERLER